MSFLAAVWRPLAYFSLPFILLRSIATSSPAARYYARAALYVYTLFSVATCSTAIAAGMLLIGRRYDTNYVVSRTFYAVCKRLMNIHVDVEGEEYLSTRPAVYMMNHQSMLDILVVAR
jgi:lysophosphatidate acyltransferase